MLMPKEKLTAEFVAVATSHGKERELYWDTALPGFGLMVTAAGERSFVIQYRNADGLSRRMKINGGIKTLAQAKRKAKEHLGDVAKGQDPMADKRKKRDARKDTLQSIVEDKYLANSDIKKLRSVDEKRGSFRRYIFPSLGSRPITEIRRSEIVRMLDKVKENNGDGAASNAYKVLRRFFRWYTLRADDEFRSPIAPGMWMLSKGDGARTLTD